MAGLGVHRISALLVGLHRRPLAFDRSSASSFSTASLQQGSRWSALMWAWVAIAWREAAVPILLPVAPDQPANVGRAARLPVTAAHTPQRRPARYTHAAALPCCPGVAQHPVHQPGPTTPVRTAQMPARARSSNHC